MPLYFLALLSLCNFLIFSNLANAALIAPAPPPTSNKQLSFSERYHSEIYDLTLDPDIDSAYSNTLNLSMKYRSPVHNDLMGLVELDYLIDFDSRPFPLSDDPLSNLPQVTTDKGFSVNQLFVQYEGLQYLKFKTGRQIISWDNERFISKRSWRQNQQSFDAFNYQYIDDKGDIDLRYAYAINAGTVFGSQRVDGPEQKRLKGESHFTNLAYDKFKYGKIIIYAYSVNPREESLTHHATTTAGASLNGSHLIEGQELFYRVEYARQQAKPENPFDYAVNYLHLKAYLSKNQVNYTLGYERLGADELSAQSFQTVYGNLRIFNGLAGQFENTPATGLTDAYIMMQGVRHDFFVRLQVHFFDSTVSSLSYGNEIDIELERRLKNGPKLFFSIAEFSSASSSPVGDALKFSLSMEYDL